MKKLIAEIWWMIPCWIKRHTWGGLPPSAIQQYKKHEECARCGKMK